MIKRFLGYYTKTKLERVKTEENIKFELYLTMLRFIPYSITENVRRIYADIDLKNNDIMITAYYQNKQTELEAELLDDIVTNSQAHIPDLVVDCKVSMIDSFDDTVKHDFLLFAFYVPYDE